MSVSFSFFVRTLVVIMCWHASLVGYDYQLAICTIFKDCSPYLKEWIEYHRLVGVEHFYLYDNESSDEPRTVLQSYIDKGIVTLTDWPNRDQENWGGTLMAWVNTTQLPAYDHACKYTRRKVKWLAIIDSDEFLVPLSSSKITDLLAAHEEAPGLCLHWAVYGTSNIVEIPPNKLMIELLTKRAKLSDPINRHTKSIVKPHHYAGWAWPTHACLYRNGASAYEVALDEARVNHYINRTLQFFYTHKVKNKEKIDNVTWSEDYTLTFLNLGNEEEDRTMDRFVPKLRKRMGFTTQLKIAE